MTCGRVGSGLILPLWVEVLWPCLDAWDSVRLTQWNVPGRYWPYGEFFFFFLKKEPMVLSELVRFGPSISAEKRESVCLDRFAHDGRRELLAVGQWLLCFVKQLG